ncbi:MAG: D-alanyl-D-alanine carboxypeptidase [Clostridia bacterium]|jgi:hypothetical protein|nr:D-alanyl-D-alanine carboxypeptidase [Clostridia bacterium]
MSTEIRKDLDELHPKVKSLALKLLEECKKEGLNIKISETYRTTDRQDYLYAQGRTRSGSIVTYSRGSSMSSYHQWRLAFDIYNDVPGDAYNLDILNKAGAIGEQLGLEWGGSWQGFRDTPHFQYTFGLSIADLRSGKRPPEVFDQIYEEAVKALFEKKIINTPSVWINLTNIHPKYTQGLIINIAKYFNKKVVSYNDAVQELADRKIINSPNVWLNTSDFPIKNIMALIKKTALTL